MPRTLVANIGQAGSLKSVIMTGTYAISSTDVYGTFLFDLNGANRTVVLPSVISNIGRRIVIGIIDTGGFTLTIDGNSGETIEGQPTLGLSGYKGQVILTCTGSEWLVTSYEGYTSVTNAGSADTSASSLNFTVFRSNRIVTVTMNGTFTKNGSAGQVLWTATIPSWARPLNNSAVTTHFGSDAASPFAWRTAISTAGVISQLRMNTGGTTVTFSASTAYDFEVFTLAYPLDN